MKDTSFHEQELQQEVHCEKLEILIALLKELNQTHIKLFERFLSKVDKMQTLQNLFIQSEISQKYVIMLIYDLANFVKVNLRSVKLNKYIVKNASQVMQENMAQLQVN